MELRAEEGFAAAAGWQEPAAFVENDVETDRDPKRLLWPALAGAVVLVWLAVAVWLVADRFSTMTPVDLVQFAAALCVVPVLVAVVWLLVQRNSQAEARRFGDSARAMRAEADQLERTVGALSRTIDDNRARLAEQVEAMLAMGDAADARLGAMRRDIGAEVARIDTHARELAAAAEVARTSVGEVLAALPGAQTTIRETTRMLEQSGTVARDHAATLEAQLATLAERGRQANAVASGAGQALTAHVAAIEATSDTASTRLEAVAGQLAEVVDGLIARTATSVDAARANLAEQGDVMIAGVGAHQAALDRAARESADALAARMASVETLVERVSGRLDAQAASGDLIVDRLQTGIADVDARLDRLHVEGSERAQTLAASISALGGSADAMTEALRAGEAMATRAIGTTETLLTALDSASREIDETLPDALTRLDGRIAGSKRVIGEAKPELFALVTAAESTHDAIEAIAGVVTEQRRALEQLSTQLLETLSAGRAKADALGASVDDAIDRTARFVDGSTAMLAELVPEAVARLESAGTDALRRAVSGTVDHEIQVLAQATDVAVEAATRAAARVAHETQAIVDQTATVETRIEQARDERERADRDTIARRVASLIEALNSASIDVTRMLSPDVSDSAWAAYLKGDRGVFTRRAVRLLDAGDARDVARLYDDDAGFREAVNRYIHDFEAMLRAILAQPDGSPLSITLLSSDMGKLYVALAQAIERLR